MDGWILATSFVCECAVKIEEENLDQLIRRMISKFCDDDDGEMMRMKMRRMMKRRNRR